MPLYYKASLQKAHHDNALFSTIKGITRCHATNCMVCGEPLEYQTSGDEKYPIANAFLFHSR
jgi:hypothetical protein